MVGWHSTSNNNRRLGPGNVEVWLIWVDTDTLLAHEIDKNGTGLIALVREGGLEVLVLLDVLNVLVEQVRRVERSSLGFRVELGAEDGAGVVDQTLVGLVVEVGEVLPPFAGEGGRINSVSMVLRGDMALSGAQVKSWDVVGTITVLELDGLSTGSKGNQLVTHADAHDRDLRRLKQLAKVVHCLCAVGWVARAVGDEDTVKVVGNLLDGVIVREAGNASATRDETTKDVLFHTAVNQSNVHVAE